MGCVNSNRAEFGVDGENLAYVTVPGSGEKLEILGSDPDFPFVPEDHNLQLVMPLFEKCRVLGQGASCEVTHVRRKTDDQEFAMKIMKRDDKWNPILFRQEYFLLTKLNHPNIVGYRDCYMDRSTFTFAPNYVKVASFLIRLKYRRSS